MSPAMQVVFLIRIPKCLEDQERWRELPFPYNSAILEQTERKEERGLKGRKRAKDFFRDILFQGYKHFPFSSRVDGNIFFSLEL